MKKIYKIMILIFLITFVITAFCIQNFSATDQTKEYSSINILDDKYSYGTIFWTENTTIEPIKSGSLNNGAWKGDLCVPNPNASIGSNCFSFGGETGNEDIVFKITNCAIDEDGDMCDVVFESDGESFEYYPTQGYTQSLGGGFGYNTTNYTTNTKVSKEECIRNRVRILKDNTGSLIRFWFDTNHAYANITIKYFKAGTNTPANVNGAVGTFFDIDVPVKHNDDKNEYFQGCEGFTINGYDGTVYCYKGNDAFNVPTSDGKGLQAPWGFSYSTDLPWTDSNTIGLYDSAVAVQNLTNATMGFLYSGGSCGIGFSFASPYAFSLDNPSKSVSKTLTTDGDNYYYTISQYVPNNYYASTFKFFDDYTGIYSNFVIEDTINSNLNIDTNNIVVTNSSNKNVNSYFDISITNNVVKLTATSSAIKTSSFYNQLYRIKIPVTVKNGAGLNTTTINNTSNTKYILDGTTKTLPSNQVSTKLQYTFKVNTSIDDGGTISNDYNVKVECNNNAQYKVNISIDNDHLISSVTIDGRVVDINDLTLENNVYTYTFSDQNIRSNKEHSIIVETEPIKRIIEGKIWLDKDRNGIINGQEKYLKGIEVILVNSNGTTAKDIDGNDIQSVTTDANGYYKFENMTKGNYKVKIVYESKYETTEKLVGTNQEINSKFNTNNETDVITKLNNSQSLEIKESNVNAGLILKDTKVIVHYYKEGTTEKLNEDIIIPGEVDDDYDANKTLKEINIPRQYELVEVPTNAEGTMTEEAIEVIYYYRLKDSAGVIVHHIDKDTNEKIAEDVIKTGKIGTEYTTEVLANIPENYEYIEKVGQSEGNMGEELIEVTYYYQRPKPVIESQITKTGSEILKHADGEVTYTVQYTANIQNYMGKATITIVDILPYEIDEEKSSLAEGTYDKNEKTITWEFEKDVNTYEQTGNEITISKVITVVYKNVDLSQEKLTNKVMGTINTYIPEAKDEAEDMIDTQIDVLTEVIVNKIWVETTEEQKERRPEEIKLIVKNGEEEYTEIVKVTDRMQHTFINLPKYDKNGNIINYTVSEEPVKEGELDFYTGVTNGNIITNTFTRPEDTISIKITKKWEDTEKQKEKRPDTITLVVKNESGEEITKTVSVDKTKNEEVYTIDGLAKYDSNGKEINYTVDEKVDNLKFYKKSISGNTITNTFKVPDDKIELEVNKLWTDSSTNKRPDEITIQVLKGDEVKKEGKMKKDENWRNIVFSDLAKYDENGEEIEYKLKELEVEGYTTQITGTTIVNTIKKVPYTVEYYYDGILDEDEIEIIKDKEYGSIINDCADKEIPGYRLVVKEKLPLEISLDESKNVIKVYYEKIPTKVIVKHLEEGTNKEIAKQETIEGFVLDKYETKRKTIYGYEAAEKTTENAEGKMIEKVIEVIYYYKLKNGEVKEKYLEEGTDKEIFATEIIKGKVFEEYKAEQKEIEGYELIQVPENATGQIKEEAQEVIYYYKALPFDMTVQKYIEKVIHNGTEIAGNKENGNIVKVDVDSKNIENEEIKIQYTIKIKNTGKVAGTVGLIEDYIPEGLEFVAEDNLGYWVLEENKATTALLANDVLEPGQEIELTLVLRWKKSGENTGVKTNIVKISDVINKFGFEEIDNANNISQTEILIGVKTGENTIGYGLIIGMLVLTLSAIVLVRRKAKQII